MGNKKKRQQPRPKKKKQQVVARQSLGQEEYMLNQMKKYGKRIMDVLKDKESLDARIKQQMNRIEEIFMTYDSVQLIGALGLYLLDNVPNFEKFFMSKLSGTELKLDEHAEVIAEYGLN